MAFHPGNPFLNRRFFTGYEFGNTKIESIEENKRTKVTTHSVLKVVGKLKPETSTIAYYRGRFYRWRFCHRINWGFITPHKGVLLFLADGLVAYFGSISFELMAPTYQLKKLEVYR